jgi:hypothetical protein
MAKNISSYLQTLLKMIVAEADLQLEDQFKFVRCY